MCVGLLR